MSDLSDLQKRAQDFRDDRGWKTHHTLKNQAVSLAIEASEVLNELKWRTDEDIASFRTVNKEALASELMDVLYHVLLMSSDLDIDIVKEFERKMTQNEQKYPIETDNSHKKIA